MTSLNRGKDDDPQVAFRVGEWLVDSPANEISRGADKVKLEPKVMRVLCFLASRPGSVVTREELEAEAWPRVVVTPDAVTGSIIKLRKALGDEVRQPRYVETLPKSGYRLIAAVDRAPFPADELPNAIISKRRLYAGLIFMLLVVFAAGLWRILTRDEVPSSGAVEETVVLEDKPGIAVLPFESLGATPGNDYFADGITLDLITDLSKLPDLRVVARNSTFAYRNSSEDERVIARDLGVDYLLRGSVQRSAGRMRINIHLTDGGDRRTLWAERYDRQLDDIFDIQDEIAARVLSALQLEIAPADQSRMVRNRIANVQAYDEFLQGLDHFGRRSLQDTELARQHFERAIEIDPGFARAYASLALVYTSDIVNGWNRVGSDALDRAAELTAKARDLDPSVPQIYFVDGLIEMFRRNFDAAIRNAEQAIARKPSYADAYALLSWILHFAGRPGEGLASMQQAVQLNPRVPSVYRFIRGALYYAGGDVQKALEDFEDAVEVNPNYQLLRIWLAAAYASLGRIDEAQWEGREVLVLDPALSISRVERDLPILDPQYRERLVSDLKRAGLPD